MKKILVLLATYNGEKYLKEQLDSIFAQRDVEVHVMARDDGSSDETVSILKGYSRDYDLKWYTGEHLNVQYGFFDLMKTASAEGFDFFAFADQDDVWDEDKLIIGINSISEFDGPALYYCGQRLVDENLSLIKEHILNSNRTLQTRFVLSDFAGCTGVFNKTLLDEVVSFEPAYMLMHDTWVLKVCLCLGGKVVVDSNPHMNYRQHSNNTVGLGSSLFADIKQVNQYINKYQVEKQMRELMVGYGERIVSPYKEICDWVLNYRTNKEYRKELLNKNNIDFFKTGLNVTYYIKVMLNKL